ncbi:MAG: putative signal transducing protein [Armatimonadota bacterium]
MTDESFEVVYQASTELDANIGKSLLEEAGIQVVVLTVGEVWKRLYFGMMEKPFAQLLVPAEDADRAKALLADYQRQVEAGAFQLQDEEEPE